MPALTRRKPNNHSSNLIRGFGSLLSVFSGYNRRRVMVELCVDDRESLRSDWEAVGEDIRKSAKKSHK